MNGDEVEIQRRVGLAVQYMTAHPSSVKPTILKKPMVERIRHAYLSGYQQACLDLLQPKDEVGVPATAVTLLNRVGEMVLKNRADLCQTPLPRLQCPGCFCLLPEEDHKIGWCKGCEPHKGTLMAQIADRLHAKPKDTTL